jgi:NitT/TauT family transport system ATP-binding protein
MAQSQVTEFRGLPDIGVAPGAIEARNVRLVYGEPGAPRSVEALQDVSFSVGQQQFVSIIGPSGCGKSTLLKLVAGLLKPTAGDIVVNGRTPDQARHARSAGFVFQTPVLFPWRTVLDNVALLLEVEGRSKEQRLAIAHEYLELVGLAGFEQHLPRQLSGGMQQRVSIARALSMDPSLLLMDEPFGALDAITRDRMAVELLRIWEKRQKTVLFVTHSISEAILLSDVVIVMTARPGRIMARYEIDLPRPRAQDTRLSPRFLEFEGHLLRDLEGDVDGVSI